MKKEREGIYINTSYAIQLLWVNLALMMVFLLSIEQSRASSAQSATSTTSSLPSDDSCCAEPNHFLTYNGTDDKNSACAYYKAIRAIPPDKDCDPQSISQLNGITFNEWKTENGLTINPDVNRNGNLFDDDFTTGEVSALYLNAADLNLARSMHGKSANGKVAYYVCNHKTLKDARRNRNRIACVAMDRSVVPGVNDNTPFTRFYIFGSGGDLRLSVELDGRGEKAMPGLCTVCHGAKEGQARQRFAGDPDIGGRFLPFDLDNFEYLDNSLLFSRGAQENKFMRLNQMIRDTDIAPVVQQLLNGWYSDGTGVQKSDFVPPGWDVGEDQRQLYLNVVKPSCRTCHVVLRDRVNFNRFQNLAKDDPNTPPDDRIGSFKDRFGVGGSFNALWTQLAVCQEGFPDDVILRRMPNAKVTFDRFWLSQDTQPGILAPKVLEKFLRGALRDSTITCPDPRSGP